MAASPAAPTNVPEAYSSTYPTGPPRRSLSSVSAANNNAVLPVSPESTISPEDALGAVSQAHFLMPQASQGLEKQATVPPTIQRQRNRQAATKCRAKTKAAVAELEATERAITAEHMELSKTVTALREEVLALKNELLRHGNCDCKIIQQYLKKAAQAIGGGASSSTGSPSPTLARPPE